MKNSPAIVARAALVLALCAPAGCAAVTVNSSGDRAVELQRYRTYAWGPAASVATGDPRLDNNEFFDRRVRMQVDKGLASRDFEKSATVVPDLLVHYHASVTQEIDVRTLDHEYPNSDLARYERYVFDAGTLFVDLVDPRTNTLIWRGWAEANIDGLIDSQPLLERRIDEAIARILERLPPRFPTR